MRQRMVRMRFLLPAECHCADFAFVDKKRAESQTQSAKFRLIFLLRFRLA